MPTNDSRTRNLGLSKLCNNCRFFYADFGPEHPDHHGQCRRRPPIILESRLSDKDDDWKDGVMIACDWPRVSPKQWCGEWSMDDELAKLPDHLKWRGEGPPPRRWTTGGTIVYRSYADSVDD